MSFAEELSGVVTVRGVTTATVGTGSCRAQGLTLSSGERTWTVLGAGHRVVGPAEEYLEYLRAQQVSPNTVKSYARALALWWQFLELFGLDWDAVTLENFGAFLMWLRTGDGPEVASIERRRARFAESTISASSRAWARTRWSTRLDAQMTMSAAAMAAAPRWVSRSGAPGPAPTNTTRPCG